MTDENDQAASIHPGNTLGGGFVSQAGNLGRRIENKHTRVHTDRKTLACESEIMMWRVCLCSSVLSPLSYFYPALYLGPADGCECCHQACTHSCTLALFVPVLSLPLWASLALLLMGDRHVLFVSFYSYTYLYVIKSAVPTAHSHTDMDKVVSHSDSGFISRTPSLLFDVMVFCMCSSGPACICSEPCVCL